MHSHHQSYGRDHNVISGLVSIVMASYNGISYIREAVQSVRDQLYTHRELIIVDDASPDTRAREILEDIVQMDTRIRVYYNTTNQERSRSRNKAMRYAQGEYIAFIDNDDLWLDPHKLSRQINFLQKHTHIGLLGTHMRYIHQDGSLSDGPRFSCDFQSVRSRILLSNPFVLSSVVLRQRVLYDMEYRFDPEMTMAEDYDMRLRMGKYTDMAILPDRLLGYRVGPHQSTYGDTRMRELRRVSCRVVYRYWRCYPLSFWNMLGLITRPVTAWILPLRLSQALISLWRKIL